MANNKRVVWDEKSHSFVDSGPSTTAEQKRVTWDEKSHSFIDNGPSTPARQAEQTATTTNTRSQFDVSPTPYFSREQQTAAPTRLQQLAAETVQQKNERQSFPTATESTPIRSRRDMLLNSYQQQINNVNDLYDKYNGNLENLSEEDAKTIQNYRDSYSRLQQYGGYDELKKQQEEDAANDRKYAAQLRGVNVDEMSALERAGGTLGGMASAAAKQTGVSALGNVTHLMNTGALKADAEYSPAMKQVATMLFYGLMDEPDSAGNEMIAEQLRTMAAYIGGDAYGDAVVNRIRERAAQARETDQYDVNNLLTDIEYDQDYQWRKMQEQIESTGIYDTMQNLSNSAAEDIQYAKDVNLLQSKFGDQIVEAGVSAISNMGDAALASLLGLSGGGALAMIPFALRSYGGSYAEALENARAMGEEIRKDTVQKADKYASLSTAIEVGTEMIWGITGIMGNVTNGGALDDYTMSALANAISNFKMSDTGKKILSRIGELAIGGMTEGLEELIGDAANYILNTAGIMNGEERGDFDWSEASNSFITGMLAAFIGEPVAVVSNKFQTAKTGKDLRSGKAKDFLGGNMTAAELVESASAAKENTELSKTLQDLIRKYGGEDYSSVLQKATNTELGRLYEAYENTMQEEFDSRELVTNAVDKAEVAKSGELPTSYARRIVKDENAMQYLADSGYEINSDLSYKEKIDEVKAAVETLASARTAFQDMEAENSKLGIENSSKRQLEDRLYNANNWQQSVGQKMAEAEMQNVNAVRDAAQSINMGQMGMETLQANYDGRQDPTAYVNAMDQAYELGRFGGELDTSKLSNNAVGLEQQRNAFIAGRADRISEQEANNAGQEIRLRNGGERNDSQGTVRQAGILESGAGQNQVGQAGYRQGEVRNAKVSSAAISEKSIAATGLKIVSNSSDKDVTAAREYAQSHGMNFVAWYGGSLWIDGVQSRGFYDPKTNTVYVRAGHALFTAEQISKHETTHGLINNGTIALGDVNGRDTVVGFRTVRDALVEKIGADKFSELVDKYVEAYAGTGMSQQEIFEEMICDAVAGMNEFVSQGHMEEAFRQQASLQAAKAVTEENAANGKRAGPSMDAFSKYSAEIVSANVEYDFGTTQQDINEYVDKAYKNVDQIDYKKYAKVDDRLANDVGDDFTDIREYAHALRNNDIRHIRNSHGETKNEKYPVTANDQKSIPSIVENYDKVFYVKKNGRSGLYYIKVVEDNLVYYLEAATAIYGNEKLLVNKQMIKTGVDDLLNIPELEAAINKKQTTAEFLADLKEIHKVYARSVYQQRSVSNSTIAEDNGVVKQNISSAGTSLNQVPALHKDPRIEWGDTNIDIGAGAYEAATEYLKDKGVKNLKWDPYNQSEAVNRSTLKYLQDGNKADTATCANVLNVIAEKDARLNVVLQAAKSIKDDGHAYFSVYEGDGTGVGRETTKGWQNNLKTREYADEIRTYFNDVQVKGKLIDASHPKEDLPEASWEVKPGTAVKFSMDRPVERTDRLIALHNMNEDALRGMLEIGGLAMPSVAVMRADMQHNSYGPISVVYGRDSVSPTDRRNRIYSADAWTPTFPEIGIKISANKADNIRKTIRNLLGNESKEFNLALDVDNLRDQIQRWGTFSDGYKKGDAFRLAFLRDTGRTITVPMKAKAYSRSVDNQTLAKLAKTIDLDDAWRGSEGFAKYGDAVRDVIKDYYNRKYGEELGEKLYGKKTLGYGEFDEIIRAADDYARNGNAKAIDKSRLEKRLDNAFKTKKIQAEYEAWMEKLGEGIIEKRGIRNNQDWYTPYGNRRSFEQLYYPYTLANIVRSMEGQVKQGKTSVLTGAGNIKGASAKQYSSIEAARKDIGRLKTFEADEKDEAIDAFNAHTLDLCNRMIAGKGHSSFGGAFDAAEVLVEVISKYQTADQIYRYLKREGYDGYYNVTREIAQEIEDVIHEARELPTPYFEGKMYRAVPVTEALAYVVPDNMDKGLKQQLIGAGANVVTYKHGDNDDRLAKVNSVEGSRFSRELDDEYMFAVNSGDMKTAQEMADQAAKQAGYTIKAYHGTTESFNKFLREKQGKNHDGYLEFGAGFYFTPSEKEASEWVRRGRSGLSGKVDPKVMLVYLSPGRIIDADASLPQKAADDLVVMGLSKGDAEFVSMRVYRFINYLVEQKGFTNTEVQDELKYLGYDAISATYNNEKSGQYVVFDPEQIKSADPVTYDDAGNVIPLSERFNPESSDIRYSRELDNFLQEQYSEYRTDKENLRLAEEGIRQLEEGSRRISDAEGVSTTERTGERSTDGRRSGSDIRTLGRGITKRFIQSGRVNLNGTKVKTTEDVARMCQIFRNPQFETARYIYVRNGKVVGMDAVSSRLPGLSLTLSSKDFDQDDLIKKIRRVKADGYYMMHNHPSGNVTPSGADIAVTRKTSAGLSLAGIKMLGHVIIDHEVYSTIDWQGNVEKHGLQGQGSLDLLNIPEIDNENLGAQIRGQDDVAKLAKGLTGDDVSVVVYANAQGKVIQIQEISNKTLKHNSQIVGHIRNQIRETGGQMTFLYTKDEGVFNKMYPAYADGVFLDLVRDSESDFISARQYAPPRRDMYLGYSSNNLPVYVNEENIKYSRELGTSELYEQNRQLRSDLSEMRRQLEQKTKSRDYWRGQTKTTEGRRLRQDDVEKLARNVIKDQNSSADAKAVSEKLKALGEYLLNSQEDMDVVYDNARLQAYEIAHDIAAEAKVLKETGGEDFFDDFKYRLKQKKIYVPMSVRNELAVDDWNGWRNSLRGKMTLTATKEGNATIDQLYQDLRAEFGDWLLPEDIANEADQLNRILEVYETYQPVYEHLNSYDMAEAVEYIANDLLGRVIGDEIRETQPTYADRMEKRLADQKTKSQAALKRVRQNRDQRVADLKQHYQEVAERRREKRIDSAERTRLLQIARRLNNKKLTRVQRSLLNQYIGELDLVAKSITGHTINDLQALQLWYDSWAASQGEDFIRDAYIEKKLERLSKRHISDMTQEEVADLTTVLLNFENEIRTASELIESQVKIDRYAAGEQTINNIRNSDGRPTIFDKYIASETVTPEREIRKITGYEDSDPLYQVTKELSKGQRDMLDYTRIAEARFKKWTENKAFTKRIAGKNAEEITITGLVDGAPVSVKITPAMRMSLYLHAKNDDNMSHIAHGGIKIPDMTLYKKGKMQEAYDKAKRVVFTRSMINEITAHMTSEEKAFADAASRYYNTMSRDAINDVSEKLKGYAIAGVENYYPIDTDGSFLKKEFDAIKRDGSIEGMGILKERLAGATTPIMLYDMNTTLNKSISQHARYYGLAIPVRNFNKLYGVTLRNYETSVSEAIRQEWSSSANKYIEKMMADVQNGTGLQKDVWGEALAKARSKYAGAVLTTNASVMFKQAASYPTAAAVVGYGPLMKALKDVSKLDLEKFAQYTPLLWYRSKGFSTAELGDIGKEGRHIPKALNWIQAMDVATTTKLVKAAMYYVNENSNLTRGSDAWYKEVATVYNRIIEETQPNYTMMQRPQILRSDSDLTRALNMFRTQPFQNFNILYDAFGNLKAKERQYKATGTPAALEALKEARKTAARAVSSQLVSAFVFSLIQFGWDWFRGKDKKYRDEDGELTLASWLKGMGINVLASGGGMIPFGSYMLELGEAIVDAVSKALGGKAIFDQKFYGLSENAAESVNDMGNALINMVTKITQTLSSERGLNDSTIRSLVDSAADIAQFVGIPASNVVKLAQSIARNIYLGTESDKYIGQFMALRVTTDPQKYKSDYYTLLLKALRESPESYENLYEAMVNAKDYVSGRDVFATESKSAKENIDSKIKEWGYGVLEDAWRNDPESFDELRNRMINLHGDPFATSTKTASENIDTKVKEWKKEDAQKDQTYQDALTMLKMSESYQKASDEQKQSVEKNLLNAVAGTDENLLDKVNAAKKVGMDETEYLLFKLALSMADEDGSGSTNNRELLNVINDGNYTDEQKAFLWKTSAGIDQKKIDDVVDGGKSVGLNETEYMLYRMALTMVDQPTEAGKYGTYTAEEVKAAIKSMYGLTNEERAYLWEAQGLSKKTNPWR